MTKKDSPPEFSIEELRQLLLARHQTARQERLEKYRRTGRAVRLVSDIDPPTLSHMRTKQIYNAENDSLSAWEIFRVRFADKTFLLVEIIVIVALIYVVYNGLGLIKDVNQNSVTDLRLPTLTATPLIWNVVLPSGHTPPTSPGGARFNDEEIPEHLRPLVQSLANIPIPTPAPEHANRIQIPAIDIDAPVIQGTGWEQLKRGVGQVIGTANPGQNGNIVLSAHNDIYGELFRYLDRLNPGDQFTVYTSSRAFTYVVTGWDVVEPTRVEVMNPTPNATATLISCYPYLVDNMRIVVKAELMES
jgi:sortase A